MTRLVKRIEGGLGRPFWTVLSASALANLADGVFWVALPLLAIGLTDSPALVAGVTVAVPAALARLRAHRGRPCGSTRPAPDDGAGRPRAGSPCSAGSPSAVVHRRGDDLAALRRRVPPRHPRDAVRHGRPVDAAERRQRQRPPHDGQQPPVGCRAHDEPVRRAAGRWPARRDGDRCGIRRVGGGVPRGRAAPHHVERLLPRRTVRAADPDARRTSPRGCGTSSATRCCGRWRSSWAC